MRWVGKSFVYLGEYYGNVYLIRKKQKEHDSKVFIFNKANCIFLND